MLQSFSAVWSNPFLQILVFILALIFTVITVERKDYKWATACVGLMFLSIDRIFVDFRPFVLEHPWQAVAGVLLYFTAGYFFAQHMWVASARNTQTLFLNIKTEFLTGFGLGQNYFNVDTSLDVGIGGYEENVSAFVKRLSADFPAVSIDDDLDTAVAKVRPLFTDVKADFFAHMAFWPVSLAWYAIRDTVDTDANKIRASFSSHMQKASDELFKNVL